MGLSASWIAIRNGDKGTLLGQLGLVETGELAGEGVPEFGCLESPSDWVLIFADSCATWEANEIAPYSIGTDALLAQMEEHVMCSDIWGFRDGAILWSVHHHPEKHGHGIEVHGDLPPELDPIRRDQERLQETEGAENSVDFIFDIPIALSGAICGFRPDEYGPASLEHFKVLRKIEPERPSLLGRLRTMFGGRKG